VVWSMHLVRVVTLHSDRPLLSKIAFDEVCLSVISGSKSLGKAVLRGVSGITIHIVRAANTEQRFHLHLHRRRKGQPKCISQLP
jgi:hypothetical protein